MTDPLKRILIVSNGHGEDHIASQLAKQLHQHERVVLPLAGKGKAYTDLGLIPCITHSTLPSGGFVRSLGDLYKDLRAGLCSSLTASRKMIKKKAAEADLIIAVGDVFCLMMASTGHKTPVYFLPTAKSDWFMSHSAIERMLIKRTSKKIYTRDTLTAKSLQKKGLPACYLGNPMMDGLWETKTPPIFAENKPVLALVPGSREEAYRNAIHMFGIAHGVQEQADCHLVWAKSTELSLTRLISHYPKNTWSFCPKGTWMRDIHGLFIHIVPHFPDVLAVADVVLGLAGTANEQAIHVGKDVFAFEGFGPQSTLKRFKEQRALMEGKLHIFEDRTSETIVPRIVEALQIRHPMPEAPTESAAEKICTDILETNAL